MSLDEALPFNQSNALGCVLALGQQTKEKGERLESELSLATRTELFNYASANSNAGCEHEKTCAKLRNVLGGAHVPEASSRL